jgi:hypothetical protein
MSGTVFIGGPWDGRQVMGKLTEPTFRVHEYMARSQSYMLDPHLEPEPAVTIECIYIRVTVLGSTFHIEKSLFDRGIIGSSPALVVLDLLRQGYRRPSTIYGD